ELARRARQSGRLVLTGHCLDFGDSALPYLPFSEVFGQLPLEDQQLTEAIATEYPAVARLLPGRRLLSGQLPVSGAGTDRGELFEAIHAALARLAQDQPLLVVVEDVHWADRSTRDLLGFLFARQFARPVSLVVSYRSDDLHRRHPLRAVAAEWTRLPQ